MEPQILTKQEELRFPFQTEGVRLKLALGCLPVRATGAQDRRSFPSVRGSSLPPASKRAIFRELLMPRGTPRTDILAIYPSLPGHQTAAPRSNMTSVRSHSDSLMEQGFCTAVLPLRAHSSRAHKSKRDYRGDKRTETD